MITDIEEESKTKFSMGVEFSFSFKAPPGSARPHLAKPPDSLYNVAVSLNF